MNPVAPRVLGMGDSAFLLEFDSLDDTVAAYDVLTAAREDDPRSMAPIADVVPAARTVLVRAIDPRDVGLAKEAALLALVGGSARALAPGGRVVEIPVDYDGADLERVASLTGLSVAATIAAHTASPWRVAFCGFAPGFAYLTGGDPRLRVPRLDSPRTRVPEGAVALAGEFSGVYPRASPGGWRVIGRTDLVMFDPDREPASLLSPGDTVRFVDRGRR